MARYGGQQEGQCGAARAGVTVPLLWILKGRLWVVNVDAANPADGSLGKALVVAILWRVGQRLAKVLGDQAHNGVLANELEGWSIDFEKASRPPWRGLNQHKVSYRWLKDGSWNETLAGQTIFGESSKTTSPPQSAVAVSSSASWLYLANSQIMLRRVETYSQI